jgi:hypothetical protein
MNRSATASRRGACPQEEIARRRASPGSTIPRLLREIHRRSGRLERANVRFGGMLLITRLRKDVYAAKIFSRVAFIPCVGNRNDAESTALAAAFEPHSFRPVKSFHRFTKPDETAWFVGFDWWLSTAAPVSSQARSQRDYR